MNRDTEPGLRPNPVLRRGRSEAAIAQLVMQDARNDQLFRPVRF